MKLLKAGKCVSKARLDGKTAIVTGSNTGIGKITAREFYRIGARVILACRDAEKAAKAVDDIKETVKSEDNQPLGELVIKKLDLGSLLSIKECAKDILQSEERINILVNNAGVMMCPKSKTADGFELQFGTNHLGHFLFTCLLLPRIRHSTPARIVNVSSLAHKKGRIHFDDINLENGYTPFGAYAQSKLANLLFSHELATKLKGKGVNVYSLHPGIVRTELGRHLNSIYFPGFRSVVRLAFCLFDKTPEEGAQTTIYCSIEESLEDETGCYYSDCKKETPSTAATNAEESKKLWDLSLKMTGLGDWDPFTAPNDILPPSLTNI
ncbi:retinol dehydrogenase 11-like [Planococcus citri]|uniref:retinol dehydrogenase 11-like n=1 Tax=Planococcus citri TaxID=170843 RepID=UPI0031F87A34